MAARRYEIRNRYSWPAAIISVANPAFHIDVEYNQFDTTITEAEWNFGWAFLAELRLAALRNGQHSTEGGPLVAGRNRVRSFGWDMLRSFVDARNVSGDGRSDVFFELTRRGFLGWTAGTGLGLAAASRAAGQGEKGRTGTRLICEIDCTQDYPAERYFDSGGATVVESPAGRYRESAPGSMSLFGYRFPIERVGMPHRMVIRYPDDKRRFMCIMDGTTYDLSTGMHTGWAQPLTGAMLEIRQVFWPRWQDCSVIFLTWGEGEPAAAARIEIWELDGLPAEPIPGDPNDGSRRELGIQYEDPCGTGLAEGSMDHREWLDHVVQYARYSGQGLLVYPMAWYHGPLFPSEREPSGGMDVVAAPNRNLYIRWTSHPADWYAALLDRFGKEGLAFQGSLTLMRLGSLMEKMNIDLDAIKGGADTYNNMLWNDNVQESTNEWTPLYNVINFNAIAEVLKDKPFIEPYGGGLPPLAYGERPNSAYPMGPMFNPLHPVVQEAILGFVQEIGQRYGKFPAFKGISFNMYASCMPWFGSIHSGYDDTCIRLFEEETGIKVPVDPEVPDRFSRRYGFLTYECRPAWVAWRCAKIRELFGKIHSTLAAARPDLRVTVTLWCEPMILGLFGPVAASHQVYARSSMYNVYRDAGIDVSLYKNTPGLEIDIERGNPRDRGGHPPNSAGGLGLTAEQACMYRDFDFLDRESLDALHGIEHPGSYIFNCWVEAWGKHVWSLPDAADLTARDVKVMDGQPADGIFRINSEYPKQGFWWDSQWRITHSFQGGVHFLEPNAHAVAEVDACRITRGGLFLDKVHSEEIQQFARAYRALPRQKFVTVGASTDPVAVRTLAHNGVRYLYAVNREYYPVDVRISFNGPVRDLRDLATGEPMAGGDAWQGTLGPYELRAFGLPPDATVSGFAASPPADVIKALVADAENAFGTFARARTKGRRVPGMDEIEERMRSALAEGRYAWLRRALTGYIVRHCGELA
jgi:hypothetical protein